MAAVKVSLRVDVVCSRFFAEIPDDHPASAGALYPLEEVGDNLLQARDLLEAAGGFAGQGRRDIQAGRRPED